MYRIPTIELLNKDNTSEESISKPTECSKPDVHEVTASVPSVKDSITSLERLHISDAKSDKEKVDSELNPVKTNDSASPTPHQLDNNADPSTKPNSSLTGPSSDKKPWAAASHQVKANIFDGPKVVGPKHYGVAPMQKLPPREKVMSALLQWKTSETVRFLAGCLPDYSKSDGSDEVSKRDAFQYPFSICDRILENSSKSHMKSGVFLHVFNDISIYALVMKYCLCGSDRPDFGKQFQITHEIQCISECI